MKTKIEITNGSGWNNYRGCKGLSLPRGSKGLLKKNGVAKLTISPKDEDRPLGIAARYFGANGELIVTQSFDQNDTSEWIRTAVVELLAEGIATRMERRRSEIRAAELAAAQAAGFTSVDEHDRAKRAAAAARLEAKKESDAAKAAADEAAAPEAFRSLAESLRSNPQAVGLTRAGRLVGPAGPIGDIVIEQRLMQAWLRINGFGGSVDARENLFTAAVAAQ